MRGVVLVSLLLLPAALRAEIVDRISILADGHAIKSSDINKEVRITEFLNQEPPNLSTDERKKAADRLMDQAVIRKEIEAGQYPDPQRQEVDALVAQIEQRYPGPPALEQALKSYGLTREDLIRHLEWQVAVLEFIRVRFVVDPASPSDPNAAFFAWLDENRKKIRIVYKEEDLKWAAKPSGF